MGRGEERLVQACSLSGRHLSLPVCFHGITLRLSARDSCRLRVAAVAMLPLCIYVPSVCICLFVCLSLSVCACLCLLISIFFQYSSRAPFSSGFFPLTSPSN